MPEILQNPSPNFGERKNNAKIEHVILHYTDMIPCEAALKRLCDPDHQVSAHYLIHQDGKIYQLVADHMRAWHAGVSYWAGNKDINSSSIGIEFDNPGHSNGLTPFAAAQLDSLVSLLQALITKYNIRPQNILGHSDIAPGRKIDPGPLFPWEKIFNDLGFPYPKAVKTPPSDIVAKEMLAQIGYDVTDIKQAILAFQLRYRSELFDGNLDSETSALIAGVAEFYNT